MSNIDPKTKSDAVVNGLSTLFAGWGCLPLLGLFLMGFGAAGLLSIPIFIIGGLAGLIGLLMTIVAIFSKTVKVDCPYCYTKNTVLSNIKTFNCQECSQKVLIKQGKGTKLIPS